MVRRALWIPILGVGLLAAGVGGIIMYGRGDPCIACGMVGAGVFTALWCWYNR